VPRPAVLRASGIPTPRAEDGGWWHRFWYAPTMSQTHLKRMRRHENDGRVRFMTFSTYQRLPLLRNDKIMDLFADRLERTHRHDKFALFAWVVMPEHVHLVLWPRQRTVSDTLLSLKRTIARTIIARWRELDAPVLQEIQDQQGRFRFWQRGGGYDRNIRDMDELREKIQYVHNNPVCRGLVSEPTAWMWSSARWYAGQREDRVTIDQWK
jgi:REP-associated tyrosine transposase